MNSTRGSEDLGEETCRCRMLEIFDLQEACLPCITKVEEASQACMSHHRGLANEISPVSLLVGVGEIKFYGTGAGKERTSAVLKAG